MGSSRGKGSQIENCKCKAPEVGAWQVCLKNDKERPVIVTE